MHEILSLSFLFKLVRCKRIDSLNQWYGIKRFRDQNIFRRNKTLSNESDMIAREAYQDNQWYENIKRGAFLVSYLYLNIAV